MILAPPQVAQSDLSTVLSQHLEAVFRQIAHYLQDQRQPTEHFTLTLTAEQSQFIRFNHAKVRQIGHLDDATVHLTWMRDQRSSYREFPLTGHWETDRQQVDESLASLRWELPQLPENPYLVLPSGNQRSHAIHPGDLLAMEQVPTQILTGVADLDFVGLYAGGWILRAYADSIGQEHWFATETFSLDYSLFTPEGLAVKGTFAGSHWDQEAYLDRLAQSRRQLQQLSRPIRKIDRGQYRTYLAPAAVAELVYMLSWGGVSEAEIQQGNSCFGLMRRGERRLSPKLTLWETFEAGLVPQFNQFGEIAPTKLAILQQGDLVNTLISSKTAKEYHLTANGAEAGEGLRSPSIDPGNLSNDRVLAELDTGLYVSNLHYLNWSDRPTGRITGMTRYACFWVEGGEIVAPIENLRFDDSLYDFWGDQLLALTDTQEYIPEVGTYDHRSPGGLWVPGMLIEDFTYTL